MEGSWIGGRGEGCTVGPPGSLTNEGINLYTADRSRINAIAWPARILVKDKQSKYALKCNCTKETKRAYGNIRVKNRHKSEN